MDIVINTSLLLSPPAGMGNYVYNTSRALLEADRRNRYAFYYGYFSDELISPASNSSKRFSASRLQPIPSKRYRSCRNNDRPRAYALTADSKKTSAVSAGADSAMPK